MPACASVSSRQRLCQPVALSTSSVRWKVASASATVSSEPRIGRTPSPAHACANSIAPADVVVVGEREGRIAVLGGAGGELLGQRGAVAGTSTRSGRAARRTPGLRPLLEPAQASSAPPARGRRPGCGRRRARARSSAFAGASASTSGPRPATPRAPPRPRRRRRRAAPPSASARTSHRPRPVDLGAGLSHRRARRTGSGSPGARGPGSRDRPRPPAGPRRGRRPSAPGAPPRRAGARRS